jgi:hypothetical protein
MFSFQAVCLAQIPSGGPDGPAQDRYKTIEILPPGITPKEAISIIKYRREGKIE